MAWGTLCLFWGYWLCSRFFRSLNKWSRRICKQALKEGHSLLYSLPHLFPSPPSQPSSLFHLGQRGSPKTSAPAALPPIPSQLKLFLIFPFLLWPSNLGVCRPWDWPWPMSPVTSIGRTWRAGRRMTWAGLKSPSRSTSPVSPNDCPCAHSHPFFPEKRMWAWGAAGKGWDVCVHSCSLPAVSRFPWKPDPLREVLGARQGQRDGDGFLFGPCPSLATWSPQHQLPARSHCSAVFPHVRSSLELLPYILVLFF